MLNKTVKPIWLASYPKSGNTWVRLFYVSLITGRDLDINQIQTDNIISARSIMDSSLGIYASQLPQADLLPYRSKIYHIWAEQHKKREFLFCKVHDACTLQGEVLFPAAYTRGVVYIMRNPFDMAASLANHHGITIDKAVKLICSNEHSFAIKGKSLNSSKMAQYMGSWSSHIESWVNVHRNNILILKYEDMLQNSLNEFTKLVLYLELNYSSQAIQTAINQVSFSNVQQQEKNVKFKELKRDAKFFRSGKSGGWRHELTAEQVNLIIDCNYEALLKYGYIDTVGNVLV